MVAKRTWRWVGVIVLIVAVVVLIFVTFVYGGIFNVAADYPDRTPVYWTLSNISDHSIQHHAAGIKVPPLNDPSMVRMGFSHYSGMCVTCHGAPGVPPSVIGKGLNPQPPNLAESAGEWKPNELFWVVKHGIRMSGMPSFGLSHSDDDLWAITAFLRQLPKTTPAEYKTLSRQIPPEME